MPLPVRYIDSREYPQDGTVLQSANNSDGQNDLPRPPITFPILEVATTPSKKLQALGLHNLTNVIRQLGSLAKHAESVMGDIADTLLSYQRRAADLEERTKRLSEDVLSSLDADREACEGFVIPHPDFHFKSNRHIDQQLLSKEHTPQALLEQMKMASSPALYQFTLLRDDGKNAMQLYSNPDFFFEHWRTSMRKEAMRRKSTMDSLHVATSGQHQSSEFKKRKQHQRENATHLGEGDQVREVHSVGRSKSFKRNPKLSRSFHGHHDRPRPRYGSNLSLPEAGRASSKSFRTYSFRATSRNSSTRHSFRKGHSKLRSHFSKATAANFDGPIIELAVPACEGATEEDEEIASEKMVRGTRIRRTLSTKGSNYRSRSRSPNPRLDTGDSVFTGMHMYTVDEELSQQEKSKLATLSKQQLQTLDLATSDFQACLSIDSGRKLSSTFTPPGCIFARSVTPILPLVNATTISEPTGNYLTPSHPPRRVPPPIPKMAAKPAHSRSNTNGHNYNLPKFHRSATISAGNPVIKKTADSLRKMYMSGSNGRPASVALVEDQLVDLLTPFNPKKISLSSLDSNTNYRSASSLSEQPHKRLSLGSLDQQLTYYAQSQMPNLNTTQNEVVSENQTMNSTRERVKSTPTNGPIPGPPPPPRNDSLNTLKKPVQASLSCGPSLLSSVAPATQRHSSLDATQKESIASALSNVLEHTLVRELPNKPASPHKPLSPIKPLSPSSPWNSTAFSTGDASPSALPPSGSANLNRIHKIMSPEGVKLLAGSPGNVAVSVATESDRKRRPPPLLKQGSLYISPRKLSVVGLTSPDDIGYSHKRKAGQILKAGGVDSGDLSGSRSNLLEAIRKGIQLRKVEVDKDRKEEAAPWDVAAILERYEVLHSDSDSDSDGDIQDWDDLDDV